MSSDVLPLSSVVSVWVPGILFLSGHGAYAMKNPFVGTSVRIGQNGHIDEAKLAASARHACDRVLE